MEEIFRIYIDRLRKGESETIDERFDPAFLNIKEEDLVYPSVVEVKGTAYIAEEELILHFSINTQATLPCLICSEPVTVPVHVPEFYHVVPLSEIKSGIFNYKEILREDIVLETPHYAECNGGKCPKRKEFKQYLKQSDQNNKNEEEGYHPFANL